MSFSSPSFPAPEAPTAPPSPPMFGTQAKKGTASQIQPTATWTGSVLGAGSQPQTAQKTLLGQ